MDVRVTASYTDSTALTRPSTAACAGVHSAASASLSSVCAARPRAALTELLVRGGPAYACMRDALRLRSAVPRLAASAKQPQAVLATLVVLRRRMRTLPCRLTAQGLSPDRSQTCARRPARLRAHLPRAPGRPRTIRAWHGSSATQGTVLLLHLCLPCNLTEPVMGPAPKRSRVGFGHWRLQALMGSGGTPGPRQGRARTGPRLQALVGPGGHAEAQQVHHGLHVGHAQQRVAAHAHDAQRDLRAAPRPARVATLHPDPMPYWPPRCARPAAPPHVKMVPGAARARRRRATHDGHWQSGCPAAPTRSAGSPQAQLSAHRPGRARRAGGGPACGCWPWALFARALSRRHGRSAWQKLAQLHVTNVCALPDATGALLCQLLPRGARARMRPHLHDGHEVAVAEDDIHDARGEEQREVRREGRQQPGRRVQHLAPPLWTSGWG